MKMNEQEKSQDTGIDAADLTVKQIFLFLKKRFLLILMRGLVSLLVIIVLLLLAYVLLPRTTVWKRDIAIQLIKDEDVSQYPSGKPFSSADLFSAPVLRQVYENNHLKDRIDFEDFEESLFMTGNDMKKALLDAEYKAKMNKRNITVIELQNLEREYRQKLQMLPTNQLSIAMTPQTALSEIEIIKILNEIPETWYKIYSKLEAGKFPQVDMNSMREEISLAAKQPGRLLLLDKTRVYCNNLLAVCDILNEMLQGTNLSLPSGEFLGDIQRQLQNINQYKILVFHQYILMNPAYQGAFDRIFIYSKLQNIEQELLKIQNKYKGTCDALALLQKSANSSAGTSQPSQNEVAPVTLQLDNSFFSQFADMVRNDTYNKLRATYAQKALDYNDELAVLEADKCYFQNLLTSVDGTKKTISSLKPEEFNTLLQEMFTELFAAGNKVIQFRDKILNEYLNSRSFYTPVGNVQYYSAFRFPFPRIILGLFAVWLLFNLAWCVFDFCQMNAKGMLREEN